MVGKINISPRAEAVRQLFMSLEKHAKKIKACWFCGASLPTTKLANQGYLSGNHQAFCVFEKLAVAGEKAIIARSESEEAKLAADKEVLQSIEAFSSAMKGVNVCPICERNIQLGHEIGCAMKAVEQAKA